MVSKSIIGFAIISALASVSVPAMAMQDAPAAEWHVISRSSATAFMVDVASIKTDAGVTSVMVARVPASGSAADMTHSVNQVDIKCRANQSRPGEDILYGADGSIEDRINDGYDFDTIQANSLDAYIKSVVCDGDRATAIFPTVQAFITAGRPTR